MLHDARGTLLSEHLHPYESYSGDGNNAQGPFTDLSNSILN